MKRFTGYLRACVNPMYSGLARVIIHHCDSSKVTTCYCEAGYGVRQLVAALGEDGQLTQASGEKKARWVIDDMGVLQSVEVLE